MSKKRTRPLGVVYSTDPNFSIDQTLEKEKTLPPGAQALSIRLDTKQRAGKVVTLMQGFQGNTDDAEELGRKLKSLCGTGGSTKDNVIIIQGDHRDKVLRLLIKLGYSKTKKI